MVFVIFVFTKHHVEVVLKFLENNIPFLTNKLTEVVENQKKILHSPQSYTEVFYWKKINYIKYQGNKPLIAQLWDYFILAMVIFFLVSIASSLVNQHHVIFLYFWLIWYLFISMRRWKKSKKREHRKKMIKLKILIRKKKFM